MLDPSHQLAQSRGRSQVGGECSRFHRSGLSHIVDGLIERGSLPSAKGETAAGSAKLQRQRAPESARRPGQESYPA
jgi:hypothetical protein